MVRVREHLSFFVVQVLSDDEKRSLYDKYGEAGVKGAGMGPGVSAAQIMIGESCFLHCISTFSWRHPYIVSGFQQSFRFVRVAVRGHGRYGVQRWWF